MKEALRSISAGDWLKLSLAVIGLAVWLVQSRAAIDQVRDIALENKMEIKQINQTLFIAVKNQEVLAQRFVDHVDATKMK